MKTNFQKIAKKFDVIKSIGASIPEDMAKFDPLSVNKVTGASVNFPVSETCQPSKVCANTCYALKGPITWPAALKKQNLNMMTCLSNPKGFADAVIARCRPKMARDKAFFLRWNGLGDLFDEAVDALLLINKLLPDLPIWVVTRKPEQVGRLAGVKNIWIHFSLDRASMARREQVLALSKTRPENLFFSYQADKGEILSEVPPGISVLFFDGYKILGNDGLMQHPALCPLNLTEDITSTCRTCRRCFNGDALDAQYV